MPCKLNMWSHWTEVFYGPCWCHWGSDIISLSLRALICWAPPSRSAGITTPRPVWRRSVSWSASVTSAAPWSRPSAPTSRAQGILGTTRSRSPDNGHFRQTCDACTLQEELNMTNTPTWTFIRISFSYSCYTSKLMFLLSISVLFSV